MARFTITLDDDIHNLLKEQAERDRRTLGQEIAYLLELYVPTYQKTAGGDASPVSQLEYYPEDNISLRPNTNTYYQPTTTMPRRKTII